jgi:hypothetical protein
MRGRMEGSVVLMILNDVGKLILACGRDPFHCLFLV